MTFVLTANFIIVVFAAYSLRENWVFSTFQANMFDASLWLRSTWIYSVSKLIRNLNLNCSACSRNGHYKTVKTTEIFFHTITENKRIVFLILLVHPGN